jgi:hypothetical protein
MSDRFGKRSYARLGPAGSVAATALVMPSDERAGEHVGGVRDQGLSWHAPLACVVAVWYRGNRKLRRLGDGL